MNDVQLPDHPADLIRVAMADLMEIEKDERYKVAMGAWHDVHPDTSLPCFVCLAGSVMAKTLGADRTKSALPNRWGTGNTEKLVALNHFRRGMVMEGLFDMRLAPPPETPAVLPMAPYEAGPVFHQDMEKLAALLEPMVFMTEFTNKLIYSNASLRQATQPKPVAAVGNAPFYGLLQPGWPTVTAPQPAAGKVPARQPGAGVEGRTEVAGAHQLQPVTAE